MQSPPLGIPLPWFPGQAGPIKLTRRELLGLLLGLLLCMGIHYFARCIDITSLLPAASSTGMPEPTGTPDPANPSPSPGGFLVPGDGEFGSDGLTTEQRNQLYIQTAGAYGNLTVSWDTVSWSLASLFPASIPMGTFSVVDVNNNGTILLQCQNFDMTGIMNSSRAWVVAPDNSPVEIFSDLGEIIEPFDLNDEGVVVGMARTSMLGTEGFIWTDMGGAIRLHTADDYPAIAKRINNHGNWVGYTWDNWTYDWQPAACMDSNLWGTNLFEGLPLTEMLGINESDEVLASYVDQMNWTYSLAISRYAMGMATVESGGYSSAICCGPN